MSSISREMFHTQEKRPIDLIAPVLAVRNDAWLGPGYYFWRDEVDALAWGRNSKRTTGFFQVYNALIQSDKILDTVFNEKDYEFWLNLITKISKKLIKSYSGIPKIKHLNKFCQMHGVYKDIDAIQFQDIPMNKDFELFRKMYIRKRIQLAVYELSIVSNFKLYSEMEC